MLNRNRNLQRFIDATEEGIRARAMEVPAAMPMAGRIFAALKDAGEVNAQNTPARLAACSHLESALSQARGGPDPIPELIDFVGSDRARVRMEPKAGISTGSRRVLQQPRQRSYYWRRWLGSATRRTDRREPCCARHTLPQASPPAGGALRRPVARRMDAG